MKPSKLLFVIIVCTCQLIGKSFAQPGYIYTVGGSPLAPGYSGDGGMATAALFSTVYGVTLDVTGNIYVADANNNVIRKIDASTGIITHIAGVHDSISFAGDGGPATAAHFYWPSFLRFDGAGNLLVCDEFHNRIRKINMTTGIVTTFAGCDTGSAYIDGVLATTAWLGPTHGIAVDAAGNVYITAWCTVKKIDPAGYIYTIAGHVDSVGFSGDGGPAIDAKLASPTGLEFDAAGNLYIADQQNHRIRKIDMSTGIITTVAGNGTGAYSGDGGPATAASLMNPYAMAFDAAGDMLFVDYMNYRIRKVNHTTGTITTIAGIGPGSGLCYGAEGARTDTICVRAELELAIDAAGVIYFGNGNAVSKIAPAPIAGLAAEDIQPASEGTTLYPNPVSDLLTIATPAGQFTSYVITNSIGSEVLSNTINSATTQVDIHTLPAGIYFVKTTGRNKVAMKQFVKQ